MMIPWLGNTATKGLLRSFYTRITLNRVTTAFFIFGFLHCFVQGILHSLLLSVDNEYGRLLGAIIGVSGMPPANHTSLEGYSETYSRNFRLRMCNYIPHNDSDCMSIFEEDRDVDTVTDISQNPILRGNFLARNMNNEINVSTSMKNPGGIELSAGGDSIELTGQCASILLYPLQQLRNSGREDLTLLILQFWLFAISIFAMIYDSVPHVVAGFVARVLVTGWSAYSLWRLDHQKGVFYRLIGQSGTPCSLDVFSSYFTARSSYQIPDLVLNVSALLISGYLSWTLQRMYSNQLFKCVGAPVHIFKTYRFFMAVQACLQLEAFVLTTAMGLWVDRLFNSYVKEISTHTIIYEGAFIVTTILIIPWILMGWHGIRREIRLLTHVFIGVTLFFLIAWSVMFYSQVYCWEFYDWPMLGCYTVASMMLIIITIVLSLICRKNFGQGLAEYLRAEAALSSSNFTVEVFERDVEKNITNGSMAKFFGDDLLLPTYISATPQVLEGGRGAKGDRQVERKYDVAFGVSF